MGSYADTFWKLLCVGSYEL